MENCSVCYLCINKFDCLVHEMLLIRELTPSLNASQIQFKQNYLCDIAIL